MKKFGESLLLGALISLAITIILAVHGRADIAKEAAQAHLTVAPLLITTFLFFTVVIGMLTWFADSARRKAAPGRRGQQRTRQRGYGGRW
jgi:heme/copper-type cytochrome/quinol oxidase subunit 2